MNWMKDPEKLTTFLDGPSLAQDSAHQLWEYPGMTYTKINPQTCWFHRTIWILDMSSYKGETMWRTIPVDPRTHCSWGPVVWKHLASTPNHHYQLIHQLIVINTISDQHPWHTKVFWQEKHGKTSYQIREHTQHIQLWHLWCTFVFSFVLCDVTTYTGMHNMVRSWFREYELKKLRSPACSRQENAVYHPHIHGTWSVP